MIGSIDGRRVDRIEELVLGGQQKSRPVAVCVTAEFVDVEGKLTSGLTGIEEVRDAVFPCVAPTALAGLIRPPLVGTWLSDQFGWPGLRPSNGGVGAPRSISPCSLEGTTSSSAPVRRARWR